MTRRDIAQYFAAAITWARESLALDDAAIGAALGTDARTVRLWEEGGATPTQRQQEQVDALFELRLTLTRVFPATRDATNWLAASVPALGGRTPAALIRAGNVLEVVDALVSIDRGDFV